MAWREEAEGVKHIGLPSGLREDARSGADME